MMTAFILVHGAGTGGWLWEAEAVVLRQRGHRVQTPTLTGVGDRAGEGGPDTSLSTHIAEIAGLIEDSEDEPVMVGFSYGGLVVGGVAEEIPRKIAALVYVDAFVPVDGRSMFDFMPPDMKTGLESAAQSTGDGWQMPPIPMERLGGLGALGSGVDLDAVRELLGRRGPHPIGTYREPAKVTNPAALEIPCAYIACTGHTTDDPMTHVADKVRAAGIPVIDLATGHFPMLTMPVELADILEDVSSALLR